MRCDRGVTADAAPPPLTSSFAARGRKRGRKPTRRKENLKYLTYGLVYVIYKHSETWWGEIISGMCESLGLSLVGDAAPRAARPAPRAAPRTVLKNASANPVTPAMAHGSKDAEGRLLGPSAATQRG